MRRGYRCRLKIKYSHVILRSRSCTNESLSMICDEETDHPIEREIPLSAFKDADEVFSEIRAFTERR